MVKDNEREQDDRERRERIELLRKQIDSEVDGPVVHGSVSDCSSDVEEEFLKYVLAYETAAMTTHMACLERAGYTPPPAASLDDDALRRELWTLIGKLADIRVFLYSTDHLSDRDLYTALYDDLLRHEVEDMSSDLDGAWHLDILGSCSDEDTELYLRHYADEDHRAHWRKQFPAEPMPQHEDPPYDRDRHLPQREYPDHPPPDR